MTIKYYKNGPSTKSVKHCKRYQEKKRRILSELQYLTIKFALNYVQMCYLLNSEDFIFEASIRPSLRQVASNAISSFMEYIARKSFLLTGQCTAVRGPI